MYKPPEHKQRDDIKIGVFNEIWSFGITYREFLTGKLPYGGHVNTADFDLSHNTVPEIEASIGDRDRILL